MVETYRCAGKIHAAFYGFDTSRFFKSLVDGLLFGNDNVDFETTVRIDRSGVVEPAHSINSVTNGRM